MMGADADFNTMADIIQAVTKGCSESFGGECHWKKEYFSLKEEYALFKQKILGETENELNEMEGRLMTVKSEAGLLKDSLESDNLKLRQQNVMLESKNKSLQEELTETKTIMDNQLSHANSLKRLVDVKCSELEKALTQKETTISNLHAQLNESKKRNCFLSQEVKIQHNEIVQLREVGAQMKQQHDSDMKTLMGKIKTKEKQIYEYYAGEMESSKCNFKKLEEEFLERMKTLAEFMENERLQYDELRTCSSSHLQQFIGDTLRQTEEARTKIEEVGLVALMTEKLVEADMAKVGVALKHLKAELKSFQLESNELRQKISNILGEEVDNVWTRPEVTHAIYMKPCYESFKNIGNGLGEDISVEGCEILELIEKERANLQKFLTMIMKWDSKFQGQRSQFHEQILHLEESIRLDKMKYIRDIDFANQKLTVYKKLIFKLRKKLDCETKSKSTGTVQREKVKEPPGDDDKLRPVIQASPCISALPKQSLPPVIPTNETESKQKSDPIGITCCAEFKYMLETSEGILKRIDEAEFQADEDSEYQFQNSP